MKDKRTLSGAITVELSYLIPIIMMVFLMTIYSVFYYHDKNILLGAASETAILGVQMERKPDEKGKDLEAFFQERIYGKLILFSGAQVNVSISSDQMNVSVSAQKGKMKIKAVQKASVVIPERKIRQKKIIEKLAEQEG